MALKITPKDTRKFTAVLVEPLDGDDKQNHSIEVQMKIFSKVDWQRMTQVEKIPDGEILEKSLIDVIGLIGADDQPMPFNDDTKKALLDCNWVSDGLIKYQLGIQHGRTTETIRAAILGN